MALNKANNIPNDGIANPFINLNGNVTSLGGVRNTPNRGATSARPTTPVIGDQYFDITTNVLQVYTTNGWVAAATKPDAPTNVVAVSAYVPYGGLPGVKVTWNTATTAVPASYYVVTSNTGGFTTTTTEREATFLGLTAGTSYTFTVAATNNYGSSSATSNAITPVTAPQAITLGTPTATGEGLSVPVTPGATGGSAITGYTLYAQPGNIAVTSATAPVVFKTNVPVTGGPISIGTRYSFSGIANNVAGPSTLSNTSASAMNKTRFVTTGLTADYDFYRGSYGGQNTVLYSEDFTQTIHSKINCSVTADATTDPLGGNSADLVYGSSTVYHLIQQDLSVVGTGAQTVSIYAKPYDNQLFTFNCYWAGEAEHNVDFYLDGSNIINGAPNSSGSIEDVGNGWYKCSFVVPARTTGSGLLFRFWAKGRNNLAQYGSGGYFWGAQCKAVGTAEGYIKTTSTAINYNTGSTIYDLSGNGYNATASNSTFTNSLGGGALVFNGTTTSVPLPSLGTGVLNYTWSSWTRIPTAYLGGRMLIGGSAGYQYGDASWLASGIGEYYYPHAINQFADVWLSTTIVVSNSNTITVYHNGYLEGSTTLLTNATGASFATVTLGTGFNGPNQPYTWGGNLGRLSFYIGKALTAAEVLQNFNADRQRYGV